MPPPDLDSVRDDPRVAALFAPWEEPQKPPGLDDDEAERWEEQREAEFWPWLFSPAPRPRRRR